MSNGRTQALGLTRPSTSHRYSARDPLCLAFLTSTDPSLPEKTIYAPINPPKDNIKMPVIVWGEGGCYKTGTFYQPYLTEIASHGYLVLANGPPVGGPQKTLTTLQGS